MKTSRIIKKLAAGFTALAMTMLLATATVQAIPYTGDNTVASPKPAFNVFTGVPAPWGNESDFFRARVDDGSSTDYSDPLTNSCANGTKFQLRVYVHNGASVSGNQNGTGPSVAHGTKVKVDLRNEVEKTIFSPNATISATNAASVSDVTTINCNGKSVKLNYVAKSASQYSKSTGVVALSDDIVGNGVSISSHNVPGDVWGCWDERVYVVLTVEVKEQPKPVTGDGVCKVNDVVVLNQDKRNVRATVNGVTTGQGASIVGYEINWGDGSAVSTKQTDTHTYTKDGTYKIVGRVQVKLADGTTKWVTSVDCTRSVKFEAGKPPVIPPVTPPTTTTTLPDTGTGSIFGIFAGTSALAAGAHQIVTRRRAARI